MKVHFITVIAAELAAVMTVISCGNGSDSSNVIRLLYWNIQNGMWDGQDDNYDRFVEFVKSEDPDICVWCEAQSIWRTDTDDEMEPEKRYLEKNWGKLAARYGHRYWGIGGHRDDYPQVITSKFPINYVNKIIGTEPDSVITHGAGWAKIAVKGKTINIVTLHTWPMQYAYRAADKRASEKAEGGHYYREMEVKYICDHTIGTVPEAENQLWMMMGDFNACSGKDNAHYLFPDDTTEFLPLNYIYEMTPYIDVIKERYPDRYIQTTAHYRIDFVFCTKPLYDRITYADVLWNSFTAPVKDYSIKTSDFWRPSDHVPIVVDFDLK